MTVLARQIFLTSQIFLTGHTELERELIAEQVRAQVVHEQVIHEQEERTRLEEEQAELSRQRNVFFSDPNPSPAAGGASGETPLNPKP